MNLFLNTIRSVLFNMNLVLYAFIYLFIYLKVFRKCNAMQKFANKI